MGEEIIYRGIHCIIGDFVPVYHRVQIPLENELIQLHYTSYYVPQMGTESQYPTGITVPIIYMNTEAGFVLLTAKSKKSRRNYADSCQKRSHDSNNSAAFPFCPLLFHGRHFLPICQRRLEFFCRREPILWFD